MKIFGIARKTATILANLSLFLNTFLPFLVAAQPVYAEEPEIAVPTISESIPTPEPTTLVESTITETPIITPTTEPVELIPTATTTPTITETPTITPTETPIVEPIISPEATPTAEVSSPSSDNSNQNNSASEPQLVETPTVTPTATPSPTITPPVLNAVEGEIETTIVPLTQSRTDILNPNLGTDKEDYAPTEIAIIKGRGFSPNTQYKLKITSDSLEQTYDITADSTGEFTYSYQLDGVYRPDYLVESFDLAGNFITSVSFTDSPSEPCGTKSTYEKSSDFNDSRITIDFDNSNNKATITAKSGYKLVSIFYDYSGDGESDLDDSWSVTSNPAVVTASGDITDVKVIVEKTCSVCGNGILESSEECDDGNSDNSDICSNSCKLNPAKVTICHWDNGQGGKWTSNDVSINSVSKCQNVNGHGSDVNDIIPLYSYGSCNYGGKNLTTNYGGFTGKQILDNGCQIPPKTATLIVIKNVINDNGGIKTASNFTITASGNKISQTSFTGNATGTTLTLETGAYSVDEITDTGYQKTLSSECTGTITNSDLGKIKTCIVTNNDIVPQLKIIKKVVNNTSDRFSLYINNTKYATDIGDNGSTNFISLNAGTATFSETAKNNNLDDYTVTYSVGCDNGQVILFPGDIKTCIITNTRKTGSITTHKFEDNNRNGIQDRGEDNLKDWDMNLYSGSNCDRRNYISDLNTDSLGNAKFDNLTTGNYSVKEEMPTGWGSVMSTCQNITVVHQTNAVVNFGNYKLSKIEGIKFYDLDTDGERDYRFHRGHKEYTEPTLDGWKIFIDEDGDQKYDWGETYEYTDRDGSYDFKNLTPGTYTICEQMKNGWTNSAPLCQTTNLTSGDTDEINFGNYQYGSISGYKWEDINGNGSRDKDCNNEQFRGKKCDHDDHCEYTEPTLEGWTITLDKGADGSIESTITTDRNGNYRFDQLTPGRYRICEDERRSDGWHNTNGGVCRDITISAGEDKKDINFGNQKSEPKLNISKSNNTGGSELSPGNSVEYKITLGITDNSINNLKVTDLLSDGFKYRVGSYKIIKTTGSITTDITSQVGEPQYHSPGLWDLSPLGKLNPEDKLELIYTADISSDQQAGKYADLAYASAVYDYDSAKNLLATATDEGYIDANYVGTDVTVNRSLQNSISAGVEKTEIIDGQVLGASTEMPATGAATLWLVISLILGSLGLILIKHDKITKSMSKKIFSIFILPLFLFLISGQTIFAESSLSVRLEQPKTPTNIKDLNLKFVALDTNGNTVTVKCLKKSPIDSDFSQYGSDIVLSAGGNASQCNTLSAIDRVGSYQFKVEANGISSNTVNVDYKDIAPSTPTDYRKENLNGNCDFKIHFRTANDEGRTVKVELYRSTDSAFTANNDSLVHSINIGSTQEADINNSVPDCSKTYYYALRAFDNAGNGSDIIGDTITVKTIYNQTSVTGTPAQGAIPVAGSNIPSEFGNDQTDNSSEIGNQNQSAGQILGSQTQLGNFITNHKIISGIIAIILLAIIIYATKKIRQSKKSSRRK